MKTESTINNQKDYYNLLIEVYAIKRQDNNKYNYSDFAKDLKISKSLLSKILSRKRTISTALLAKIFSLSDKSLYLNAKLEITKESKESDQEHFHNIFNYKIERFRFISQWYHLGILNLLRTKNFKNSSSWIAQSLNISQYEAENAIRRLITMGLIREKNGRLERVLDSSIQIKPEESIAPIRAFHSGMIQKAKEELSNTSKERFDRRYIGSITFNCNDSQIVEIKKHIEEFHQKILSIVSTSSGDNLYQLNSQFFSLLRDK